MSDRSEDAVIAAATAVPVFSADRIAELLAVPPKPALLPTAEQRTVIEHPLAGSTLVVAGAGSGKTETMANRVVWLVANGLVAPDHILGLTFTRKAAGELRERITGRLLGFVEQLRDAATRGLLSDAELARTEALETLLGDGLDLPEVSTYNAFAAGVLQEFGAAAGLAPGATIIDEATAWRIAREVMVASTDPALITSDLSIPMLTEKVIGMDHAVSDHMSSLDRVDAITTEFARVAALPYDAKERDRGGEASGRVYAPVRDAVGALAENPLITRLAREYAAEKQRRGVLEFSDQLALASLALERSADAIGILRARHRAVLLDEVQDTSVGQTRFLARLFAGSSVMAVGDPHQSIYGWRGASAAGLGSFHADFRAGRAGEDQGGGGPGSGGTTLNLSTSWRNPESVLAAANIIAGPLAAESKITVPELGPRPGAAAGAVEWRYPETLLEERVAVAEWLRGAREEHRAETGEQATAAVIFRNRRHMAAFAAALADVGVPARIVGVGGLLTTPEVTDVVSTLRCLWYADAGSDLIRILAGPRFRIGAADLAGLNRATRWFAERDGSLQRLSDVDREADAVLPDPDRAVTIIDALDRIAQLRDLDHGALSGISFVGRERLRDAGRLLAALRQLVGGDITELVTAVVQALRIDIELDANERSPLAGTSNAHANLDRFLELVEGQLAIDERGTLASLLEWLERSAESDQVAEHVPEPSPGTVHLITAHGSKGLEWDLVAVPRLVTGEFPSAPREGGGWLRTGQLPDELRGDAAARPKLDWRIADTQQELKQRMEEYRDALKERFAEEERRLAYVAVTRSAGKLLLSGSFWGGQKRQRVPSPYLSELAEHGLIAGLPELSEHEEDPSASDEERLLWPLDPLGRRANAVGEAAALVRQALPAGGEAGGERGPETPTRADWPGLDESVALLLAERRAAQWAHRRADTGSGAGARSAAESGPGSGAAPGAGNEAGAQTGEVGLSHPQLPERITASTFHEFVEDPQRAERNRLRPVPQRPYRRTRVGNRFHEWVERRATTAAGRALPLAGLDELDRSPELDGEAELQPLIEVFERSRWAGLAPIAVEQEVTLPFAGRTLVCKLDAVYRVEGTDRLEVVDWKAGRSPRTAAERESRFFQLDLYRHAYSAWAGIDPDLIDVTLFYVAEGVELSGHTSRTVEELERIWLSAAGALG